MIPLKRQTWLNVCWQWTIDRWNRTPGYLKWAAGILLGALVRLIAGALFPEHWERISHPLLDPTMPIWLAVAALAAMLVLERALPPLYRRVHSRRDEMRLRPLFGVRWAAPPDVDQVQGPYCSACAVRLRGTLWSGDSSPTLWLCPSCGREFSTPEFADIGREAERLLAAKGD